MNIPFERDTYFHRIGRTARIGNKGKSITLIAPYEKHDLINLKRSTDLKINEFEGSEPNDIKTLENMKPTGNSSRKPSFKRSDQYNRRNRSYRGRQNRSSRDGYPRDTNRSSSRDNNRSYSRDNNRSYSGNNNRSYSRDNKRSYSSDRKKTTPRRSYDRKYKKSRR